MPRKETSFIGPPGTWPWHLLKQEVPLKTAALALVPVIVWIAFLFLFASVYHAAVHVRGWAGIMVAALRLLVELGTLVIALRLCFEILRRGAAQHLSIDRKDGV